MKHNILPDEWCVANCKSVREYIANEVGLDSKNIADSIKFTGYQNRTYTGKNEPFGQLLTEEQFLYCIGEPVEGEEIEVSNTDFESEKLTVNFFGRCRDGAIITEAQTMDFYENYRRKPLQFEVDKWAKEKAAFAEGKTIQCKQIISGEWVDIEDPQWDSDEYRIKPEPKYVKFTREDWDLFKMKEIAFTAPGVYQDAIRFIVGCDVDGVVLGDEFFTYEYLFEKASFINGSVCGKLIEE